MKCIIKQFEQLVRTTEIIGAYLKDPIKVIEADINAISFSNNILKEEDSRNIQVGLSSDMTKEYATNLGKRLLVNSLLEQVDSINRYFIDKSDLFKTYSTTLVDVFKPIESFYNNGIVETRVDILCGSEQYKKYFKDRLERDFLPTLNSSTYNVKCTLTIPKLIIILKTYLDKVKSSNSLDRLTDVNDKVNTLIGFIKNLEISKNIPNELIPSDKLDKELLPVEDNTGLISTRILNKQQIGNLLTELASDTPELETGRVDPIEGMLSLANDLRAVHDKLNNDILTVDNIFKQAYKSNLNTILDNIKVNFESVCKDYLDLHITDDEFISKVNKYINILIRLIEIDNKSTGIIKDSVCKLVITISNFVGIYHMYYNIMMYSIVPAKEKLNRELPKQNKEGLIDVLKDLGKKISKKFSSKKEKEKYTDWKPREYKNIKELEPRKDIKSIYGKDYPSHKEVPDKMLILNTAINGKISNISIIAKSFTDTLDYLLKSLSTDTDLSDYDDDYIPAQYVVEGYKPAKDLLTRNILYSRIENDNSFIIDGESGDITVKTIGFRIKDIFNGNIYKNSVLSPVVMGFHIDSPDDIMMETDGEYGIGEVYNFGLNSDADDIDVTSAFKLWESSLIDVYAMYKEIVKVDSLVNKYIKSIDKFEDNDPRKQLYKEVFKCLKALITYGADYIEDYIDMVESGEDYEKDIIKKKIENK